MSDHKLLSPAVTSHGFLSAGQSQNTQNSPSTPSTNIRRSLPKELTAVDIENARLANSIELRLRTEAPAVLLTAIARADRALKYSSAQHIFHCICLGLGLDYCGVFGDGDNGGYEWFIWEEGKLETSNVGYGNTNIALRDVLNELTKRGSL